MYKMPSRFFGYSWLICLLGFCLRSGPLVKVIGNPISDGIQLFYKNNALLTSPCLMFIFERVEKSQVILALLDGFLELHLDW